MHGGTSADRTKISVGAGAEQDRDGVRRPIEGCRSMFARRSLFQQSAIFAFTLVLALTYASSATAENDDGPADAEWVRVFCEGIGAFCGSYLPFIVPDHDLVMGFFTGDCSTPFAARRLSRPASGSGDLRVEGRPPAGVPVAGLYDARRDRVIYFFSEWSNSGTTPLTAAAVELGDPLRWEDLVTSGAPPATSGASVVLDTRHDQVLLYGGYAEGPTFTEEVWALSLRDGIWKRISPRGPGPGARAGHTGIYDPVRDRMVVFGGWWSDPPGSPSAVWELILSGRPRWSKIEPAGEAPPARSNHVAVYDSREDRMVIEGGVRPGYALGFPMFYDLWALPLRGRHQWRQIATRGYPPGAYGEGAAYDAVSNRVYVGDLQCMTVLQWDPVERSPLAGADSVRVAPRPGRIPPILADARSPMADEEVRLYDITGRLVLARTVPDAAAWLVGFRANLTPEASTMASGVYFARVRDRRGSVSSTRAVLLRR